MKEAPIIVYTCVAGGYEKAIAPAMPSGAVRFVCFTDDPRRLEAPGWEMAALESPPRLTSGHDINRFHKAFPHRLFPAHRWSVYQDGNVRYDGDHAALVDRLRASGAALGAFWHRAGHDFRQEVEACRQYRFDRRDFTLIERQLASYERAGLDLSQKIPTNNLLVRDHAVPGLDTAMSLWWAHLFQYTRRDQIGLLHALRECGLRWEPLDGTGALDPALVQTVWHSPRLMQRIRRRLRAQFGIVPKG